MSLHYIGAPALIFVDTPPTSGSDAVLLADKHINEVAKFVKLNIEAAPWEKNEQGEDARVDVRVVHLDGKPYLHITTNEDEKNEDGDPNPKWFYFDEDVHNQDGEINGKKAQVEMEILNLNESFNPRLRVVTAKLVSSVYRVPLKKRTRRRATKKRIAKPQKNRRR
jgi:hypothetical protein